MQALLSNGSDAPLRLLRLCKELDLIDDYAIRGRKVEIRQGNAVNEYSPRDAEAFLDLMLDAAPLLKRMASDLPRLYR